MDNNYSLKKVAKIAGIATSFINAWNEKEEVKEENIRSLLEALDYDLSSKEALKKSVNKINKRPILQAVKVVKQGKSINISLNIGKTARISELSWKLTTEDDEVTQGYLEGQIVSDDRSKGGDLVFSLPGNIPLGYHSFELFRKSRRYPYQMKLIITPSVCYKQKTLLSGDKSWGPSIQLYTLKSSHNWGIGDFGDLKQLVSDIAIRGGDFIGLNPLHSLFINSPKWISPYSPSSREWLNYLYIDVTSVPEFFFSKEAQEKIGGARFQSRLIALRETTLVDHKKVTALKMCILPLLYQEFKEKHQSIKSSRFKEFKIFVKEGGRSLQAQAGFDALHRMLNIDDPSIIDWAHFPEKFQHFEKVAVQNFIVNHPDEIQFFMYLQWIAAEQIKNVQEFAIEQGMSVGLYRDLAVGVAQGGVDTWSDPGYLSKKAEIGAPPDIFGPLGQNWCISPYDPKKLQNSCYESFINLVRANMKYCGALRIDHILGLLRLWWIPKGKGAPDGAYVYYPVDDLLSILALESHRNRCTVIGEDLGVVPQEIVVLLNDIGIYSYKVFYFEKDGNGSFRAPNDYIEQSMATICTHDMPTLRGFWNCDDLKLGKSIGIYRDEEKLEELFVDRKKSKKLILEALKREGFLSGNISIEEAILAPMNRSLSDSMQLYLGSSSSSLLSLQLEDWLEMDLPVNVPGTIDEYPNWQRKLSKTLEELFSNPSINNLLDNLTKVRKSAKRENR